MSPPQCTKMLSLLTNEWENSRICRVTLSSMSVKTNPNFSSSAITCWKRTMDLRKFVLSVKPLEGVTYLPCKKHIEDNMKAKMPSYQLDASEKKIILEDVFGSKIPPKRGLVDCNTTDEFETMMAEVTGK